MPKFVKDSGLPVKQEKEDLAGLGTEQIPSDEVEDDSISAASFHSVLTSRSTSFSSSPSYFSLSTGPEEEEEVEEQKEEKEQEKQEEKQEEEQEKQEEEQEKEQEKQVGEQEKQEEKQVKQEEQEEQEEEMLAANVMSTLQSSQIAAGSHCSFASCSMLDAAPISKRDKDTESFMQEVLDKKVAELVQFFLLKYQTKELITKAEMLNVVFRECTEHFPVIMGKARQFTELVFGIVVKELSPRDLIYISYSSLDSTYHRMLRDYQSPSKTGLLIFILGMILMEGDCILEEQLWEILNALEVYAEREHAIYGNPRMLISDWIQKGYLVCQHIPRGNPKCYAFQWGSRAHAEVSEGEVWNFLAKLKCIMLSSFPAWCKDGLSNVREPSL